MGIAYYVNSWYISTTLYSILYTCSILPHVHCIQLQIESILRLSYIYINYTLCAMIIFPTVFLTVLYLCSTLFRRFREICVKVRFVTVYYTAVYCICIAYVHTE